jgi:hypothetical protein
MIWLGTGVLLALATRVLRARKPEEVERFLGSLRVIGPLVLAPASLGVVGLDGAQQQRLGLPPAMGTACTRPLRRRLRDRASGGRPRRDQGGRANERGDHDEALRQFACWSSGYRLIVVLLIAATWDMVMKPGA